MWEHRVWRDPVIAAALSCRYCLGSGEVAHVDDAARAVVTVACPVCSTCTA
ncbi:hypothetical protein [Thermobispora bispora]|uniref:hypothetical protein n=1 Tax=Thermobispora bispora TaxID=2006 RepID=UPI0002D6C492|nr:hypothetical protein [Thermobispora bispora]MDI9581028.1 hypothetical protein [Thermobispora sp.]